jgi:molybdopterin synthase catalytic subunit
MIRVQEQDFDPGAEIAKLTAAGTHIGGVCTFVGLVRDFADDQAVSSMTLEHYAGMTEKQLEAIEQQARARWPLDGVVIVHRFGRLQPGDRIVLVGVASAHREAAFEACHFLIDWLKTKAPFWKKEEGDKGSSWVDAKQSDDEASKRWDRD